MENYPRGGRTSIYDGWGAGLVGSSSVRALQTLPGRRPTGGFAGRAAIRCISRGDFPGARPDNDATVGESAG